MGEFGSFGKEEENGWKKSLHLSCQLPQVNPRRRIQTISKRVDLEARTSDGDSSCGCQVCNDGKEGRYTCPKCGVVYCSVACYRQHDVNCTESFYRNCVLQHQQLESSLQPKKPLRFRSPEEDNNDNEEEWLELAQSLALASSTDQWHEIFQRYPIHVQEQLHSAFQQSMDPSSSTEMIQPWHPFWLPNYNNGNSEMQDKEEELDEKHRHYVWDIPPFQSLYQNKAIPQLQYNTVEILYWVAFVLRRYNGIPDNYDDDSMDLLQDAVDCLLSSSHVLSTTNVKLESISQVFLLPTSNKHHGFENSNTSEGSRLSSLMQHVLDVWYIMSNKQMILSTLLRARHLISSTMQKRKKKNKKIALIVKKLEFYASWCQYYFAPAQCQDIQMEIHTWMMDWSQYLEPKLHSDIQQQTFLPTSIQQQQQQQNRKSSPSSNHEEEKSNDFLLEVSSSRKLSKQIE